MIHGLADQDRLTNLLEKDTGREYLNFGTSGDFVVAVDAPGGVVGRRPAS